MSKKRQIQRAQQRQQRPTRKPPPSPSVGDGHGTPARLVRLEAARRSRHARARLVRIAGVSAVILIVVGFVGWNLRSNRLEERSIAEMTSGACRFDRTSDPGRVNEHVDSASFEVNPPSGGVHDKSATAPGVFSQSATPPDGQVVHALEHGDIAIWYRQDAAPDVVEALRMLNDNRPDDVLILSRPNLKEAVVAAAWRKRLLCDELEPESLSRFIDRYADEGPESPPESR